MAFFLATNGQLRPYQFKYLEGEYERARLEPTEIHSELEKKVPRPVLKDKKEFFSIDVMNKPVFTLPAGSLLSGIREEMKKHGIRHVPLVKENKLMGMVSDRDLLKVESSGTFYYLKADSIMSTVIVVADEETPLAHIARVLLEEKISAIPIIDESHHLSGMITRTDILKAVIYNRLVLK